NDAHTTPSYTLSLHDALPIFAINFKDGAADNEGHKPVDEAIELGGEPAYLSTLPIRKMVDRLIQNGLPADVSNTAGAYLCNNIRSEEHTSELQSRENLVCRLL